MILSQIAAMAQNRVVGANNKLPWHLPEDLNFFREKTRNKIMIMGRKTFDSLPKVLPHRYHIVISRSPHVHENPSVTFVQNIEQALEKAKTLIPPWPEEVFIVGGGEIYKQSLPLTDKIYLTVIEKDFHGDTYFPQFDLNQFEMIECVNKTEPFPFSFRTYQRK